jgi:hypothetical protein
MKLDFSEVRENSIVPEGEAELRIVGASEKRSQNGTNMLVLDMRDSEDGFVRDNVCLEGAGAFRARQLFQALGISEDDVVNMEAADFIGMSVCAEIIHEEYNGQERAKVKKYIG